MIQIQRT